jgi:hypothetical protein
VTSGVALNEGETYTAVVTAFDRTADAPWTIESDPLTFRVDSNADATSFVPASGTILSGSAKSTNFTINLDRAANPSTVSPSTVKLTRGGGDISHTAGCSNTPCTSIVVDPSSDLGEGRYTVSLSGVTSADEGMTFSGTATYAVPYTESGGSMPPATIPSVTCAATPSTKVTTSSSIFALSQADPGTTAFLNFDITNFSGGGWSMQAVLGSTPIGNPLSGAGNGSFQLQFPAESAGNLHFELTVQCGNSGGASATASNLFGSRNP